MKKSLLSSLLLIALFTLLIPQAALAHNIGGSGMISGISHPLTGLDHMLAMIAVGVISTQLGGKAVWQVPATFVSFMIIGGFLAIFGFHLPAVEIAIALSVLVLGVAIAFSSRIPAVWAFAVVALFAIFHGHAHGEEMPVIANAGIYAIGLVTSTTILHIIGVLIGHYAKKTSLTSKLLQFAGASTALFGLFILLQ